MPNMASMNILKNDGTTTVSYVSKAPAGGDGTPAIWRNESVGVAPAHFPELRFSSRDLKRGAVRNCRATFVYPQIATNTTTGVTSVIDKAYVTVSWDIPRGMPQVDINEVTTQLVNCLAAPLIKDSVKGGFAPT